jgi:dipeptidyl aminopeptidase/acylaminoacyl peptidase
MEGVPPITVELKKALVPYQALGVSGFRGWHSQKRAPIVTTGVKGTTQLHLVDVPLGKRAVLTRFGQKVESGAFQPKGGPLLLFASDLNGNEDYQLYALRYAEAAAQPVMLTDGLSKNLHARWSHDGKWVAYSSARRTSEGTELRVVNPLNPAETRVLLSGAVGWEPGDWSADDRQLVVNRGTGGLSLVDTQTGVEKRLTPSVKGVKYEQPRFLPGQNAVVAISNEGSDLKRPVKIDLETLKRTTLAAHVATEVEAFEVSPNGKWLAFVTNEYGFGRLRVWDLALRKELPLPKIPGDIVSGLQWHPERSELGFSVNSAQSPADAYSLEVETGMVTRWTERLRKSTLQEPFAEAELLRVKSADEVVVSGLLYRPDARKFPGKRPVIMIFHGGPWMQSRPGFLGTMNYYVNQLGIALLYPNVRGSGGFGKKFEQLDNAAGRESSMQDVAALGEWVSRDARLDGKRMGVMGGSYGGYMTLMCLVRFPALFRCGVESSGISNLLTFLEMSPQRMRNGYRTEYGDERKEEDRQMLAKLSPARQADQIRAPLMIIHGKNDPRVLLGEAQQIREALRASGARVWYVEAADEGHGFSKGVNRDFEQLARVRFFQEML